MKEKKDFLQSMGEIDERFILEAENVPVRAKKRGAAWKWATAGICAALMCAILAVPFMSGLFVHGAVETTDGGYQMPILWNEGKGCYKSWYDILKENNEVAMVGTEWYQSRIADGAYQNYLAFRVIGEEYVGEKLGDSTVDHYLAHRSGETENHELLKAEVYAIRGVPDTSAVCVRYLENGHSTTLTHFYVFVNEAASFAAPHALADGFALSTYLDVQSISAYALARREGGVYGKQCIYTMKNFAPLYELIFSEVGTPVTPDEALLAAMPADSGAMLMISADCASAGQADARIQIFDAGYLLTTIGQVTRVYKIGAEHAEKIFRCVDKYASEVIIPNDDTPTAATGGTWGIIEQTTVGWTGEVMTNSGATVEFPNPAGWDPLREELLAQVLGNMYSLYATVEEASSGSILVTSLEGERSFYGYVYLRSGTMPELAAGDTVKIVFDGCILETYPEQIRAYSVKRVEK